jgi:hypothetical protein
MCGYGLDKNVNVNHPIASYLALPAELGQNVKEHSATQLSTNKFADGEIIPAAAKEAGRMTWLTRADQDRT